MSDHKSDVKLGGTPSSMEAITAARSFYSLLATSVRAAPIIFHLVSCGIRGSKA